MRNSEYLFLAGAAGFAILPSILRRTGISGTGFTPAGAAITAPATAAQGQIMSAVINTKNTGYVTNTFGIEFAMQLASGAWLVYYVPGGVSIAPGVTNTTTLTGAVAIPAAEPVGPKNLRVRINSKPDMTGTDLDTSTGSITVGSGIAAAIISVSVKVV